jgi:phosphinothricin acetyltransferase
MVAAPVIRASLPEDIPAITAIYAVHVCEGFGSFELTPPSEAEMARRRQAVIAAGLPYLIAELDSRIAGYAYASPFRPRPAYAATVENSVYVADWAQRRGVGRTLLTALIEACAAAGKQEMIAVIGDSGNVASIRLHQAVGFYHVGTLQDVGFKHGRWLDVVLMQRRLSFGAHPLPTNSTDVLSPQ